ncbi:putative receptor-like protein kinase [Panicum miliaceum]|uniref:Receptor-like protein kinase n=1 Tax=Panicum miliaceum TaxID=4540 RepID=A0A3L6PZ47_PANMI|nr:putative receptor-like protein kinase [Panicum miliaceum]
MENDYNGCTRDWNFRSWAPSATPRRTTSRRPGHLTTKSDVWRFGVGVVRDPRSAALHRAQPAQERAEAPGPGAAALRRKQAVRRDHGRAARGRCPTRGAREVAALADGCPAKHAREVVERLRQAMRHTEMDGAVGAVECQGSPPHQGKEVEAPGTPGAEDARAAAADASSGRFRGCCCRCSC